MGGLTRATVTAMATAINGRRAKASVSFDIGGRGWRLLYAILQDGMGSVLTLRDLDVPKLHNPWHAGL